ncbi:MAG: RNA-binding protein [Thermoplasmata archaeon]
MPELEIRNRHRLKQKEVKKLVEDLKLRLGRDSIPLDSIVDRASASEYDLFFVDNQILAFEINGIPFLTLKGILKWQPERMFVEVDEGAVKFVANGADVMGPGIVSFDNSIKKGDVVFVRDAKHKRPLAVGLALKDASELAKKEKGKCVKNIHWLGDKLWNYEG